LTINAATISLFLLYFLIWTSNSAERVKNLEVLDVV